MISQILANVHYRHSKQGRLSVNKTCWYTGEHQLELYSTLHILFENIAIDFNDSFLLFVVL